MAELVAVQSGLALFRTGEVGVIIGLDDLNPYDPQPVETILASGEWDTQLSVDQANGIPLACFELAEAALEGFDDVSVTASAHDARLVRVPKNVKDAVSAGLRVVRDNEELPVSLVAAGVAEKLASGTVTVELVKRVHARLAHADTSNATTLVYGGDAGRRWAARVAGEYGLTAAAPPPAPVAAPTDAPAPADAEETGWIDPEKPHVYVTMGPDETVCAVCALPEADPIHVTADEAAPVEDAPAGDEGSSSGSAVTYFATFAPDGDQGTTFKVDTILAKDESGSWWLREFGEWVPTQAPEDGADLVQLDAESYSSASTQLDEPGTEYAELSISEERLYELAEPHLDWATLDAIFAAAPFVPTAVRSANAKKQLRDSKGHFIVQGGQVKDVNGERGTIARVDNDKGTVEVKGADGQLKTVPANEVTVDRNGDGAPDVVPGVAADAPAEAPVARLDAPGAVVTDLPGLIQQYKDKWAQEKSAPVTAAGPRDPLIPPDEPVPASPAPSDSGPVEPVPDAATPAGDDPVAAAGVTPLYLAEVDRTDTAAVLACIAVVPSTGEGDAIDVYRRKDGKWVADQTLASRIQGPTPPPVVELDSEMLANVLSQMDKPGASTDTEDAPVQEPVAAAGYAVLNTFSITASGELTSAQSRGARLLLPYGDTVPTDITQHLNELAAGVDTHPGAAERLRVYWTVGEGGRQKVRWGQPGDGERCIQHLSKYMGKRAAGYCQLRHHEMTGTYMGHGPGEERPHAKVASLVGEVQSPGADVSPDEADTDLPHEFDGPDGVCATCGRPSDHPIHVVVMELPDGDEAPDEVDALASEPHPFEAGPEGLCECGKPVDDPIHTMGEYLPDEEFAAKTAPPVAVAEEADYDKPHAFVTSPDANDGPDVCDCGRPKDDPIHAVTAAGAPSVLADTATEVTPGQRFRIPLVVPEGLESGDGRTFAQDSLSSRDMPLALMWQPEGDEGHKGSVIVGRVDHVERTDQGLGNAYGVFDTGIHGQEALRLVKGGMLRGISADLDEFEADVLGGGEDETKVTSTKLLVNKGRLMGITLVAKPAYAECTIELADEGDGQVPDGEYTQDTGEARVAALIASAAPLVPPKAWFQNPGLSKPTHLTVDDDGRVFGHIAAWDVDHIGLPFGTRAPRSASGYAYFRTGVLRTAEGDDVPVGQLTLAGGHAPLRADARAAVQHYDDTKSGVADLAAGEDEYGIWVAGALRPGVTPEQVRVLRASSPSGDWRPINNKLELVAVCQVNVPGFPVARAMVSSGVVTALVAAGALSYENPATAMVQPDIDARIAALEVAEQRRLELQARELRARMSPILIEKRQALTAAALAAKERVDVVRNERKAKLEQRKAELQARIASAGGLHVVPEFEEEKHPRDDKGKFRAILAKLNDALHNEPAAAPGLARLDAAAKKEDDGDHSGAAKDAEDGAQQLEDVAKEAAPEVKVKLERAIADIRDAAKGDVGPDAPAAEEDHDLGDVIVDEITDEAKNLIEEAVTRAEQQLDPANPKEALEKLKAFLTGTRPWNLRDIQKFVKNQLKREFDPDLFTPPSPKPAAPKPAPPSPPTPV